MMFLVIWIGFEDLDLIGFDSLQVDWIWIWIVASMDLIDSKNLDWIFGFFQPLPVSYLCHYGRIDMLSSTFEMGIAATLNPLAVLVEPT